LPARVPLFPPWSDSVLRFALVTLVVMIVGVPTALWGSVRSPLVDGRGETLQQPVDFDHRHHVGDDRIDCRYCHFDVDRAPYAGVPDTRVCMHCHTQIWRESTLLKVVQRSWAEGIAIEWRRIHDLPDFVFFNHARHVRAGVGCETCHGRVDQMPSVHQVVSLHMTWCLGCHRDPAPYLRPPELVTEMGVAPDRERGAAIAEARHVNPPTDCTGCHR
jgi:hypothetical protein